MDGPDKYTLGEQTKSLPDLQVPGWFLAKRVKTPQRLNRISIPIRVLEYLEPENSTATHKNTGQETVSPSNVADGVYGVSEEYYSELRDTVNAAFVRNSKNELPLDESCVFVSSTTKNSSGFLEALVLHLAKDIEAILIEVDIEDLNDLADHFQRQEDAQSVAECQDCQPNHDAALDTEVLTNAAKEYFAASCALDRTDEAWKKSQNAVEALLNTPRSLVMGPVESRNEDEPVAKHYTNLTGVFEDTVILCVRDLDRLGYSTQTKIIARLQEGIKDRRRSKEHFILLFTTIEGEDSYLYMDYDYTYPPDEVSLASKFRLTMNSFTCAEKHGAADTEKITGTMNTRRLKRALRQRAYQAFPSELLEPFADWSLYGIDCYSTPLGESLWSRKDLHRATIQIVGRSRSKSQLDMEDIRAVLSRLRLYRMPEGSGGQSDSESNLKSQDDAEDKWKEKIDAVKGSCNTFEKELISSVVNPADIATSFDDVILDQEIKEIVKHVVMLSTFNVTEKSSTLLHHVRIKGVLLYGPPGCGKTHLSRAIAKAFGASMLAIDAATVQSKWVGETEKYIKATFSLTEKLSPCVLFIDEADALFYRRSSEDRSWERNALTQFLQQMDGLLKSDKSPLVVVATNRPADLDDAFLRRLPQKIMINLPHEMARIQILRIYLKPDDIDPSVNIESIAAATEGYSASDLRDLCAEAAVIWFIEKQIDKLDDDSLKSLGHLSLNMSHISKALKKIRPTVSRRSQRDLVEFSERFNPDLAHKSDLESDGFNKRNVADALDRDSRERDNSQHLAFTWRTNHVPVPSSTSDYQSSPLIRENAYHVAEVTDFEYNRLLPDEFRLLVVQPGLTNDPLVADLQHATLSQPPPYHALSYTWGSPTPVFYLACKGVEVPITKNLHDALRAMRDPEKPITIWADAICINQKDNDEKSVQVALMRYIYKSSARLFIWIGDPEEASEADVVMDTFAEWEQILLDSVDADALRLPQILGDPEVTEKSRSEVFQKLIGLDPINGPFTARDTNRLSCLGRFYSMPWFKRVWIIQEVISAPGDAKNNITVAYGHRNMSWDTCAIVTNGLAVFRGLIEQVMRPADSTPNDLPLATIWKIQSERHMGHVILDAKDSSLTREGIYTILKTYCAGKLAVTIRLKLDLDKTIDANEFGTDVRDLDYAFEISRLALEEAGLPPEWCQIYFVADGRVTSGGRMGRLFEFLQLCRQIDSTDPRDKIFAFMGLLESELGRDSILKPDYNMGVVEVFTNLTLFFIQNDWCLDILELQYDRPRVGSLPTGLPSWVVDWTQKSTLRTFESRFFSSGGQSLMGATLHPSVARIRTSVDRRTLFLSAWVVGDIRLLVPAREEMDYDYARQVESSGNLSPEIIRLSEYARADSEYARKALENFSDDLFLIWVRYRDILQGARSLDPSYIDTRSVQDAWSPPSTKIPYASGQSLYEAFWRTLVCDINSRGNKPQTSFADAFESYHQGFDPRIANSVRKRMMEQKDSRVISFDQFSREHRRYTDDRRFCVTDTGLMGWGTQRVERGDSVCIIPGARVPYISEKGSITLGNSSGMLTFMESWRIW